ncbi:beta-ketoacyl synthase [Streptomyces sp. NWU49]|uniref:beta-ketoacyl-[acyl-carrier-protein] synthase family protein n=1 Tax=Streptomyces sp. NWU49 TaxID=2201153 RepID=UPI0015E7EA67|nr:beta-ketoacyl-[acyl-carrier-protein] synthase family protein [Streptomyces sp. NWU49]
MPCGVAVTGMGLLTPAGRGLDACWQGLCEGVGPVVRDPDLAGLPTDLFCPVPGVGAPGRRTARRLDRFAHLALVAARDAVTDAGLSPDAWDAPRVGVVLGIGGNSLDTYGREFRHLDADMPHLVSPTALTRSVPNMVAAEAALDLGARGPGVTIAGACASGAMALGVAAGFIEFGACDIVLAGSGESTRGRMSATCFHQRGALSHRTDRPAEACRPFDAERDGLVLSEGAAILVLEDPRHVRRRDATARAVLRGHAFSSDAYPPLPRPDGAAQAMRQAIAAAGCTSRRGDHLDAHGTATVAGDAAEAPALWAVFGAVPPPVTAPKSALGHSLGASGAIEAAVTVLALERQEIPPTANLRRQDAGTGLDIVTGGPRPARLDVAMPNSSGLGGQNALLLFGRA